MITRTTEVMNLSLDSGSGHYPLSLSHRKRSACRSYLELSFRWWSMSESN